MRRRCINAGTAPHRPNARTPADAGERPPFQPWHCQVALATTQTLFVIGSVYLKRCLQLIDHSKGQAFHPLIYALSREALAGPILWALAIANRGARRGGSRVC